MESYNISKWQRKQKKRNKYANRRKRYKRFKWYNDKRNNNKSLKISNKQYCHNAVKNIKYNIDNYIDNIHNFEITSKCHICETPFLLKDLPMTGHTVKPLICACCLLENNYSINHYTIAFTADCMICDKNYHYPDLVLIDKDCKLCKDSLSKYFNREQSTLRVMCIHCAAHTDICTTGKKSKFCSSYKRLSNGFLQLWSIPVIRTDIINEPTKWEFKPHFCGYKIWSKDTFIKGFYSILDEKYKIFLRKDSSKCNVKTCHNLDDERWCVYHRCCTICDRVPFVTVPWERFGNFRGCSNCGEAYCEECGTSKYCRNCFLEQEKKHLLCLVKHIIDGKLIYDDIISVIFNYAHKHALICAHYKKCKNVIISETSILEWINRDYGWHLYEVKSEFVDQNAINNCSYMNGRYIRTFCNACSADMYVCEFCGNGEFGEICWNHPKYKCVECNKELFCYEKTDNLCRKCGQYSCGQCAKSKHKICDECFHAFHPICEKYAITDIVGDDRCKQCEIENNRIIAAHSKLSPTANAFIPLPMSIMSPQQNWQQNGDVQLIRQNELLLQHNDQLIEQNLQLFQQNLQLFQQNDDMQLFRQNQLLFQHTEQLSQQNWQLLQQKDEQIMTYQQQLPLIPNYMMMNTANNYSGNGLHYNCNNYCNNYNQYQ